MWRFESDDSDSAARVRISDLAHLRPCASQTLRISDLAHLRLRDLETAALTHIWRLHHD